MFFAYFSFKYKKAYDPWAYKREKKYSFMLVEHLFLAVQVPHLIEHGFYEMHTDVLWLTSFSGEMVIYAFFLGFFSPSRQMIDKDMNDKRLTKSYKPHNEP